VVLCESGLTCCLYWDLGLRQTDSKTRRIKQQQQTKQKGRKEKKRKEAKAGTVRGVCGWVVGWLVLCCYGLAGKGLGLALGLGLGSGSRVYKCREKCRENCHEEGCLGWGVIVFVLLVD
jgi:hypothetical protein